MKDVVFDKKAFKDYENWEKTDPKIFIKIKELVKDILRDPFDGIGKPEPLKYKFKGFWSRRINDEHRLVYKITENEVIIISCKYHYKP
jgi:toxin YoeB